MTMSCRPRKTSPRSPSIESQAQEKRGGQPSGVPPVENAHRIGLGNQRAQSLPCLVPVDQKDQCTAHGLEEAIPCLNGLGFETVRDQIEYGGLEALRLVAIKSAPGYVECIKELREELRTGTMHIDVGELSRIALKAYGMCRGVAKLSTASHEIV